MRDTIECAAFFAAQLNPEAPHREAEAGTAMERAGRLSSWRKNEACDVVTARGAVACIVSGVVRKFALRPSGQRQIIDLALAGDYVGLAPADPIFCLEAVSNDTRVMSFARDQIDDLAARFPSVASLMHHRASDAIGRLEHHLLVQSRITARDKVGAYLAAIARRVKPDGANAVMLPITRYDIADHLGIAVETVSRTMTLLCRGGSITLRTPRDVEIRDPSILADIDS